MRPTDTVLEEELFLHLFSGATDGRSFGRRIFFAFIWRCDRGTQFWKKNFFCIYLAVRPTDTVLEEELFLHLFSGATDGHSFGRRIFFAFI